jgi:hypothetical protein
MRAPDFIFITAHPSVLEGSIDRAERISAVIDAGAAAFTAGTAALDGVFPAPCPSLEDQLRAILRLCGG